MNKIAQAVPIGTTFFGNSNPLGANNTSAIGGLVSLFLNVAFVVAGLILLFYFIWGGIGLMSSAGENDPQKIEGAKKTLTSALIGFVIVFAAYYIVQLLASLFGLQGATVFGTLFGSK